MISFSLIKLACKTQVMTTHHVNLSHQEHFFAFFLPQLAMSSTVPQTKLGLQNGSSAGAQLELAEVADLDPLG
jgi:hypothetical protein